jgi:hypothetical protein
MLTIPNPPSATPFRKGNLCTTFSYELICMAHASGYLFNSATGFLRKGGIGKIYLYFLSLGDTFYHF